MAEAKQAMTTVLVYLKLAKVAVPPARSFLLILTPLSSASDRPPRFDPRPHSELIGETNAAVDVREGDDAADDREAPR